MPDIFPLLKSKNCKLTSSYFFQCIVYGKRFFVFMILCILTILKEERNDKTSQNKVHKKEIEVIKDKR